MIAVMSVREDRLEARKRPPLVPRAAVLVAGFHGALWLSPEGEIEALTPDEARARAAAAALCTSASIQHFADRITPSWAGATNNLLR